MYYDIVQFNQHKKDNIANMHYVMEKRFATCVHIRFKTTTSDQKENSFFKTF